jgi:hypothetical protein
LSSAELPLPYKPSFKGAFPLFDTAVVINSRPPTTTGLECPSPGISVFHLMLRFGLPDAALQLAGAEPSPTPPAPTPR